MADTVKKPSTPAFVEPKKQPGQISELSPYFTRRPYSFIQPTYSGTVWRNIVGSQPVAMACKEAITNHVLSWDWQIIPRDPNMIDELKSLMNYYADGIENDFGIPYSEHIEMLMSDMLDLPFGGAVEIGRNDRNAKVHWLEFLDGATLYPTGDRKYPVQQLFGREISTFPDYRICRSFLSPTTNNLYKGWGTPPPEKIYRALTMLALGDTYYAGLLLNTPEAGILNLGAIEAEAAQNWIQSFKSEMNGVDGMKIPVMYENDGQIQFIPFGKPPTDMMFDRITLKYAALVCAGYGVTLSDIGLSAGGSGGGDTMAGSIRDERKTRNSAYAVARRKVTEYMNNILPHELTFKIIDFDDEENMAYARSTQSFSIAMSSFIKNRIVTPKEARRQARAKGFVTIEIPEEPDESDFDVLPQQNQQNDGPDQRNIGATLLEGSVPASLGGGLVKMKMKPEIAELSHILRQAFNKIIEDCTDTRFRKVVRSLWPLTVAQRKFMAVQCDAKELKTWDAYYKSVIDDAVSNVPEPISKARDRLYQIAGDTIDFADAEFDVSDEEAMAIIAAAYISGINQIGQEMLDYLYEVGEIPLSRYNDLTSLPEGKEDQIITFWEEMKQRIDNASIYFIARSLITATQTIVAEHFREGIEIDNILYDNQIKAIFDSVRNRLTAELTERADFIAEKELSRALQMGRIDQILKAGLRLKQWVTTSDDPCDNCIENEKAGWVDVDHLYPTLEFGLVKGPLSHGSCQCFIKYNHAELRNAYRTEKQLNLFGGN